MILVFGSINMDLVMPVAALPKIGETVLSSDASWKAGGKGANQALAASRIGVKTALVGRVGDDVFGERLVLRLRTQGVVTSAIGRSTRPTGTAAIMVDAKGENSIVVSAGANADVTADQVPDEILKPDTVVFASLEVPMAEITTLFARAKKQGSRTILNVAPYTALSSDILANTDIFIMNEVEAQSFQKAEGQTLIITRGAQGARLIQADGETYDVPALDVDVIDTTGAGDCFCGTFAGCLKAGMSLKKAMRYASVAASLACAKMGAQGAYPYLADIEKNVDGLGRQIDGSAAA